MLQKDIYCDKDLKPWLDILILLSGVEKSTVLDLEVKQWTRGVDSFGGNIELF